MSSPWPHPGRAVDPAGGSLVAVVVVWGGGGCAAGAVWLDAAGPCGGVGGAGGAAGTLGLGAGVGVGFGGGALGAGVGFGVGLGGALSPAPGVRDVLEDPWRVELPGVAGAKRRVGTPAPTRGR